jgi:SAM-dependent methyltransferase
MTATIRKSRAGSKEKPLASPGRGPVTHRPQAPRRARLSRTLSGGRWAEYRATLLAARDRGYVAWSLEQWLLGEPTGEPALLLRHDVDQHPATALRMLEIEAELGMASTWYFRWRTASPAVIEQVRQAGGDVGLHYETLTRLIAERGLTAEDIDDRLLGEARRQLGQELDAFAAEHGPVRTMAAHGDTRVPGVTNQRLIVDDRVQLGHTAVLDSNAALRRHRLGFWLTDRSAADGGWVSGVDPVEVLGKGLSPVLLLTHPNNWCSGASLWQDRMRAAVLPAPRPGSGRRARLGIRTGSDRPAEGRSADSAPRAPASGAQVPDWGPIARSLRREILRFYYDRGRRLTDPAGLTTLATNAELAESRAATLEQALRSAGIGSVRGLELIDLGCGFGSLSLVFALRGARVTAVDPNRPRSRVGEAVARHHGLDIRWAVGAMPDLSLPAESFGVAVMNNSLCYLVGRRERLTGLRHLRQALRPGGVVVIRNPNRLHPVDRFTGVPLLGLLPPAAAGTAARVLGRSRSHVRLLSNAGARRELRRAGFVDVASVRRPGERRLKAALAGYQHLVGRAPTPSDYG